MNTKIHVSHVSLYVLYLLQTVATFMSYLIWPGSDIAMNFFCPSSLLVMLADTGVSLLQWILLVLWILLRVSPIVLGVVGFWHRAPRKLALILATVSTGLELICSLLLALFITVIPLLLTAVMTALCIKGFIDLKNEWNPSDRKALPPEEINARVEALRDKLNNTPYTQARKENPMKKHIPQIALLLLCILRPFARVFNMLAYFAAYVDESAGFLIDLAALVWGIVGVAVASGLVFRVMRKIGAYMTFAVTGLDILACLFFAVINGGLMMLFILISLFLSAAMLLLAIITLRTPDGEFLSDRLKARKASRAQ